jgi:hypothetical protein
MNFLKLAEFEFYWIGLNSMNTRPLFIIRLVNKWIWNREMRVVKGCGKGDGVHFDGFWIILGVMIVFGELKDTLGYVTQVTFE